MYSCRTLQRYLKILKIGIPIFPGETEVQQLYLIIEYLGIPPNNMIAKSKKKSIYFDEEYNLIKLPNSSGKFPHVSTKRIEKFLDYCNDKFIDLIKVISIFNKEMSRIGS